jgi:type IV secretory pathway protease TraF
MTPTRLVAATAAGGVLLAALPVSWAQSPRWLWNTTASAPLGLYRLQATPTVRVGDWLAIRPPAALAAWLDARGALPSGVLLLKRAAALAPSEVCRRDGDILIDGTLLARALTHDRRGLPLPIWAGCRQLQTGQVFVLNAEPQSLDSRYFGALPLSAVVGRAQPLWLATGG